MSETPSDAWIPPQRVARLLRSGACGTALLQRLVDEFSDITRADLFWGVALAWSDREVALLASEAENRSLRGRLARPALVRRLRREHLAARRRNEAAA